MTNLPMFRTVGAPSLAVRERARHERVLAPRPGVRQDDQAAGVVLHKVLQPRRAALHQPRRGPRLLSMQQVHLRGQCSLASALCLLAPAFLTQ